MTSCKTTLPASWYTSKAMYDLERKGIFMKVCMDCPNYSGVPLIRLRVGFFSVQ